MNALFSIESQPQFKARRDVQRNVQIGMDHTPRALGGSNVLGELNVTNNQSSQSKFSTGIKIVDKLIQTHGVSSESINNPFQLSVYIPSITQAKEVRRKLSPFNLNTFPHAIWLAIQKHLPLGMGLAVHQFNLPHLDKVLCWVLVNHQGKVIEKSYPVNKPKYVQASRALIGMLLGRMMH